MEQMLIQNDTINAVTFFLCITFAFKWVVDGAVRYRLTRLGVSEELLRAVQRFEGEMHRAGALRWGLLFIALALALSLIEVLGIEHLSAGVLAILAGFTGIAHLSYLALSKRLL